MSFIKMFGRQRKPRSRPPAKRRKPNAFSAKVGLAPGLRRSLTTDLNFIDVLVNPSPTGGTWNYTPIFLPTVGTGSSSRYGDKSLVTSIRFLLILNPGPTQTVVRYSRVVIYVDQQPNGAAPTPDIYPSSVVAFPNPDLRYRYKILRDMLIPVCPNGASTVNGYPSNTGNDGQVQRGIIRCNIDCQFTASAGAITDVATGAIGVAILSDGGTGGSSAPTLVMETRVLFKP